MGLESHLVHPVPPNLPPPHSGLTPPLPAPPSPNPMDTELPLAHIRDKFTAPKAVHFTSEHPLFEFFLQQALLGRHEDVFLANL